MNEVISYLKENPVLYFATCDQEGNPKVRPFQFMLEKEGKLYFCTSNQKKVYHEIQSNPKIELCVSTGSKWLRLSGKVIFTNDIEVKKVILDKNPLINQLYKTPDNPIFETFYLENVKAAFYDFSGQPPKEYNF